MLDSREDRNEQRRCERVEMNPGSNRLVFSASNNTRLTGFAPNPLGACLMFTGKQFRVKTPTTAVEKNGVELRTIILPAGAVIHVIDGPKADNPLVRVVWGNTWLLMVEQDIRNHCEQAACEGDG